MDRMHRQRKSPCLSFDMYISNHFLNRIFFPSLYQMPLSLTRDTRLFFIEDQFVFSHLPPPPVDTSTGALICCTLAFSSLLVVAFVFQVVHIINIYTVIHCHFTDALSASFFSFQEESCNYCCIRLNVEFLHDQSLLIS